MAVAAVRVHVTAHARVHVRPHVRVLVMARANGDANPHARVPAVITLVKAMQIVKSLGFRGMTCRTPKSA